MLSYYQKMIPGLFALVYSIIQGLKKFSDKMNNNSGGNADNDHRNNRKIEFEIFFFYPYISGQPA